MFTFIELGPFARARETLLDDDALLGLQRFLMANPQAGDVIPASGGCRKLRWAIEGRGKRGGARVVYFLRLRETEIVMVTIYAKNVRENIDPKLLLRLRQAYDKSTK